MTRLIDADELKESMRKAKRGHYSAFSDVTLRGIFQVIDNAPTVEPEKIAVANVTFDKEQLEEIVEKAKAEVLASIERPQSEWKVDGCLIACNKCGRILLKASELYNFCPNCGAEMRKGGADIRPQTHIRPKDDDDTWKEDMQRDADAYYESQEGDE